MGNAFWPCLKAAAPAVELIFWGGATERITLSRGAAKPLLAGEIMFRFHDHVVCHADSFFIGRPVPALSVGDQLLPGHTYFILPVDRLPDLHDPLTAASLTSLSASRNSPQVAGGGKSPFEYVRGADGRASIKVHPEFVTKLISVCDAEESGALCSTPELKKHYEQLAAPSHPLIDNFFRRQPLQEPTVNTVSSIEVVTTASLASTTLSSSPRQHHNVTSRPLYSPCEQPPATDVTAAPSPPLIDNFFRRQTLQEPTVNTVSSIEVVTTASLASTTLSSSPRQHHNVTSRPLYSPCEQPPATDATVSITTGARAIESD
ncbi:hypothetical protein ZIOFF_053197 [Zingiber officinale]|uniref:Uncharacterized protein n=1 Tax=Zingiber officinale TaxID=94328 RepID=A0A8J5FE44_ZINOF|nr:hypothetical protein ZIOFF_053197 [Zingiber officinale]